MLARSNSRQRAQTKRFYITNMPISLRRLSIIAILFVIVVIGYFARLGLSSDVVPPAFREARQQSSIIAQDIVNTSNAISGDLVEVNRLDQANQPREALALTAGLIQKTQEIKLKAASLSAELEKMASTLTEIKSEPARQEAIKSITNRMALIGRLLSYSNYVLDLAKVLEDRFREVPNEQNPTVLIAQINAEVTAINNFNREAAEALDRFDQYSR